VKGEFVLAHLGEVEYVVYDPEQELRTRSRSSALRDRARVELALLKEIVMPRMALIGVLFS
jgi:hypothetical protein